jgi:16S rRNA (guanine966-N2)-methyltransferase
MTLEPLEGARLVDLYAGSGALGIEALSRGASRVDFVEHDRVARQTLDANLEDLGLRERSTVWPLALPAGLTRLAAVLAAADVVLLDPPYGSGATRGRRAPGAAGAEGTDLAAATLAALGRPGALRAGARVVAEHHRRDPLAERVGTLARTRERHYGETVVSTYEVAPGTSPATTEEGP